MSPFRTLEQVIGQLSVGPTGTVQPLLNGAVDDPAANLIGQGVGDGGSAAWCLAAGQSGESLVRVGVEPPLDGAWVDGQIVCDVLVASAALGQTDDQEAFTDFGVGFLAEGVVEPLSFLQRQADANQGIKVPLVG